MSSFRNINATVLFVQDLDASLKFYRDQLGFDFSFSDDASHYFRLGEHDFLLLKLSAAAEMVGEDILAMQQGAAPRILLCVGVDSVDAVYEDLTAKGVEFLKPPKDQPWGRRTAYFADPENHLWELYQILE
jgi:catechol 2,3-dioxygenase-like lactoylglutathione lyase family enzyme